MRVLLTMLMLVAWTAPAAASGPLPQDVRINEVFYDADGSDGPHVFTEIWGPAGLSLDAYTLVGVNGAVGNRYEEVSLDGVTIPADGLLVLATAGARCLVAERADVFAAVDWQNGPDSVVLEHAFGLEPTVVDALAYGSAPGQAGEGTPAPDVNAGWSLTRDAQHTDTGDNAADFQQASPTPGFDGPDGEVPDDADDDCVPDDTDNCPFTPNPEQADEDGNGVGDACEVPPPVPEPGTLALTGLGLVALLGFGVRRRRPLPAH